MYSIKPDSNHFALDTLQPGWREIELHPDGRIETRVKRIKQKHFYPIWKKRDTKQSAVKIHGNLTATSFYTEIGKVHFALARIATNL